MAQKIEVMFSYAGNPPEALGGFSMDQEQLLIPPVIPAIGELAIFDRDGKHFSGKVVGKIVKYAETDTNDERWDVVTQVMVLIEKPEPDANWPSKLQVTMPF